MADLIGETKIANIALTHLGEAKIDGLGDENQRARLCKLRFDDCRNMVLRSHPWSCVTKRAKLSLILDPATGTALAPVYGFTYMYQLPNDFLRVLQVDDISQPYQIETYTLETGTAIEATSAPVLLTDATSIKIKYIHNPPNVEILTPDIANLIGLLLASELAEPLTAKVDLKQRLDERFILGLAAARSTDSMQGTPEVIENFTWLNSRGTGLGGNQTDTLYYKDGAVRYDVPAGGRTESPNSVFS
jgi:hypothetical protein